MFFWSHSVVVSTTDFESVNLGSNPGKTYYDFLYKIINYKI